MCYMVTAFTLYRVLNRIEQVEVLPCPTRSMGAGECRRPCGAIVYTMSLVFDRTGIWSAGLVVSASVWDSRTWNFWVKSLSSSAGFGGRLKRPSPCLICSVLGRDRVCALSETSEKCGKNCILGGIRPSYSWILAYAELERKQT